jgi:hypothetical protein
MAGAGETAIASAAALEGYRSLQRLGVEAAVAGLTTPAELWRTLSIDAEALSAVCAECAHGVGSASPPDFASGRRAVVNAHPGLGFHHVTLGDRQGDRVNWIIR